VKLCYINLSSPVFLRHCSTSMIWVTLNMGREPSGNWHCLERRVVALSREIIIMSWLQLTRYIKLIWISYITCMRQQSLHRLLLGHWNMCKNVQVNNIHCVPKNETGTVLNILYSCKSVAVKFRMWYPHDLSYY